MNCGGVRLWEVNRVDGRCHVRFACLSAQRGDNRDIDRALGT